MLIPSNAPIDRRERTTNWNDLMPGKKKYKLPKIDIEVVKNNLKIIRSSKNINSLKVEKKTHWLTEREEDDSWYSYLPSWPFSSPQPKSKKTSRVVKCFADTFAYGVGLKEKDKKLYKKAFKHVKKHQEDLALGLNEKSREFLNNIIRFYMEKNQQVSIEFQNPDELQSILYGILKVQHEKGKITSKNKAIYLALKDSFEPSIPKSVTTSLPFLSQIQKGGFQLNHTVGPLTKKWKPAGGVQLSIDPRLAKLARKKLKKVNPTSIKSKTLLQEMAKTREIVEQVNQKKIERKKKEVEETVLTNIVEHKRRTPPKLKSLEQMIAEQKAEEEQEIKSDISDDEWKYERGDLQEILEEEVEIKVKVEEKIKYDVTVINHVVNAAPASIEDDPSLMIALRTTLLRNRMVISPNEKKKLQREYRKLQQKFFGEK